MGSMSKMVQLPMERFRRKWLGKLTQPGLGDEAKFIRERDMKCGAAALRNQAGIKQQQNKVVPTLAPATSGEVIDTFITVPGKSLMPQLTSRTGSSHNWLVPGSHWQTNTEHLSRLKQRPIHWRFRNQSLLSLYAVTCTYSLPYQLPYRDLIWMKTWWLVLHCQKSR